MLQAYYTRARLARAIFKLIGAHLDRRPTTLIDLAAGSGRLTRAARQGRALMDTRAILIEPDRGCAERLEDLTQPGDALYLMTAEEWAITHAQPRMAELVFSNPPFGERLGTTHLGEFVRELHAPDIERFETYFMALGAELSSHLAAFIVPLSFLRSRSALTTLRGMSARGMELVDARSLPIDGFEGATVACALLLFKRTRDAAAHDASASLCQDPEALPSLFGEVEQVERSHRHGLVRGHLMPTTKTPVIMTPTAFTREVLEHPVVWPTLEVTRRWPGARMERAGRIWELGTEGWTLAQRDGHVDGIAHGEDLARARLAFTCLQRGALELSRAVVATLDLELLRRQCAGLAGAAFLRMLSDAPPAPDPLAADMKRLGVLDLTGLEPLLGDLIDVHTPHLVHTQHLLLDTEHWTRPQRCALLERLGEHCPAWIMEALGEELRGHQIPVTQLELRAPWLGRAWVAREFGLRFDEEGYFTRDERSSTAWHIPDTRALIAYLNYSRGPRRILDGDAEHYELLSRRFAAVVNDWEDPTRTRWRVKLHARYIASHTQGARLVTGARHVRCARELHPWQRDDLGFCLSGEGILDWDVGLGKTAGALNAAAHHAGQALIAVPKSVLAKWMREAQCFFPTLRVEVLGFRQTRTGSWRRDTSSLEEDTRRLFFVDPPQIILTSHEVLSSFNLEERTWKRADREDAYARLGESMKRSHKLARERFVYHAARRNFAQGGALCFEDLPLGQLLVIIDEAHRFKSLFRMPSAGWGNALVMAGSCGESKRARDLKIKLDLLRRAGGKALGLTATPVSNSIAELFNMLRLFAPSVLEARGIHNTQALIDTYCELRPISTVSPVGALVSGQTLAGFRNTSDLARMLGQAMRSRTAASVGLALPEEREHVLEVRPTPQIRAAIQRLQRSLDEHLRGGAGEDKPHIFSVLSDIDHIAACPQAAGLSGPSPKEEALITRVLTHLEEPDRPGQLIFADRLEAQELIRERLLAEGVAPRRIQLVNASTANSVSKRLRIQDAFNHGELDVLIGGDVMSEGMDLQTRCRAIHFVNLGWESQSIHQRKGRGIRQGNPLEAVDVYYYILQGSTDVYRLATSQNKTHWWQQLRATQLGEPIVDVSIFADPLDEDLIASLSAKPDETLATLQRLRQGEELGRQVKRASKLLGVMLEFAHPEHLSRHAAVLWRYERALRALHWLEPLHDEMVRRLQRIAHAVRAMHPGPLDETRWRQALSHTSTRRALTRARGYPNVFELRLLNRTSRDEQGEEREDVQIVFTHNVEHLELPPVCHPSFEALAAQVSAARPRPHEPTSPTRGRDPVELVIDPATLSEVANEYEEVTGQANSHVDASEPRGGLATSREEREALAQATQLDLFAI